jgi:hypothetical protein
MASTIELAKIKVESMVIITIIALFGAYFLSGI